jgi:hypothetical protein
MPTPEKVDQYQYKDSINRRYWDDKYVFENFKQNPVVSGKGGGASTGTAGDENILVTPQTAFEYHVLGTQTITAPQITALGLDMGSMDDAADDGLELNHGILSSQVPSFIVGTDAAFFFRTRFSIEDVSGTDDLAIGFRKIEANQANVDDYADMSVLNVISGNINIETIVGGAATTTTDTTDNWADTETHELQVNVSATGVVTYLIDGIAPTTTAAFTFTDGLNVMPFLFFLQNTDIANAVPVMVWECGYLV